MGYACPVCGAPQRDAEHLANHLAFTAMLHGDAHEAWLDDHAEGWANASPAALGERVAPHAEETSHEAVFEDTTRDPDRGRPFAEGGEPPGGSGAPRPADGAVGREPTGEATRAALAEARALTREMYAAGDADEDAPAGDGNDGDSGDEGKDEGEAESEGESAGEEKA